MTTTIIIVATRVITLIVPVPNMKDRLKYEYTAAFLKNKELFFSY